MKQKITYIFTLLVMSVALLAPATALAETGSGSNSGQGSSSSSSSSDDSTTETEKKFTNRDDRLEQFKTRFKVKLGLTEIAHIKLKCVASQSVVGNLRNKFGEKAKPRTAAYTNLEKRLDSLVTKLKAKSVDTATLETQITELKAKITTFTTDLDAYKQAIGDLKDVACKDDPTAFQAALLAARSAHETLIADILAIRTYMVTTLRPTLQTIKQNLVSQETKDDSQTDQTNTSQTSGSN